MSESTTQVMDKALLSEARQLETWLESEASGSTKRACRKRYKPLIKAVENLEASLATVVPEHRPLDI